MTATLTPTNDVAINKTTVRTAVQLMTGWHGYATKKMLQKKFNLDPRNEEDRPKVWRLSQCLAELVYGRWIEQGNRQWTGNGFAYDRYTCQSVS